MPLACKTPKRRRSYGRGVFHVGHRFHPGHGRLPTTTHHDKDEKQTRLRYHSTEVGGDESVQRDMHNNGGMDSF